jgi:hypothetical protein
MQSADSGGLAVSGVGLRRFLAGMPGSNPAEGIKVCLLWEMCVVRWRSLRLADPSGRGVILRLCVGVIEYYQTQKYNPLQLKCVGRKGSE